MVVRTILFLSTLLLCSCYEQFIEVGDLDLDGAPKLVVEGILHAGHTPTMHLSALRSIEGNDLAPGDIRDAEGFLLQGPDTVDRFIYKDKGVYVLENDSIIKAGQSYSVHFSAEGFSEVHSDDVLVPDRPPSVVTSFDINSCILGVNDFQSCLLQISFSEPTHDVMLEFSPSPTLERRARPSISEKLAPVCQEVNQGYTKFNPLECLKLGNIDYFLPHKLDTAKYGDQSYTHYELRVGNISSSYFNAMEDLKEKESYQNSLLFEPSLTYTNIRGGTGFLGAVNDTTLIVELE